jgi:hypothetical protein
MRPRFLIDIIEGAVANAINRGRREVDESDCVDSVRQYSLSLVDDFGFEMRDVSGISNEVLYALIGVKSQVTRRKIIAHFEDAGFDAGVAEQAFDLMLWYGLLGVYGDAGKARYIYDYQYNMKRLRTEIAISGDPGKRAAFEILTELPVDWDVAAEGGAQADEPYRRTNQRDPDMVLLAESGWSMGEIGYGPDRKAQAQAAIDRHRLENGQEPIDWSAE